MIFRVRIPLSCLSCDQYRQHLAVSSKPLAFDGHLLINLTTLDFSDFVALVQGSRPNLGQREEAAKKSQAQVTIEQPRSLRSATIPLDNC